MANNDNELVANSIPEWDEERDEYDVEQDYSRPIKTKVSLNQMTSGFEFDTSEEPKISEKDEMDKKDFYWSREEIIKHLETNPKPSEDICNDSEFYDERVKHMDDICNNRVFKKVVRRGIGEVITENSAVLYNLNAYLEGQDEPFDSTWLRGRPYLHKLSYDTILPGICVGLLTMRRGERSELMVRPDYAYLDMGCPPRVPPNATILYIVEVVKVFEEGSLQHLETMDIEERNKLDFKVVLEMSDSERVSGNSYFKAERYKEAAFRYRRAIRFLEQMTYKTPEEEESANKILFKLYCNIANTFNKLQKPFNAMSNCKKALNIDAKSHKALYQYGLAKMMNADYKEAKEYLFKAHQLKPRSNEIYSALERLDHRMAGDSIVSKDLYRRMGSDFSK